MTSFKQYTIKPATIGTTAYLMSRTVFPQLIDSKWSKNFTFASDSVFKSLSGTQSLSVPVMAGLAVGLGSVVSEFAHDMIFPHIHFLDKSSDKVALLTAGGISGAGMAGSIYLANPAGINDLGLPTILAVGMASEIVGDQLYSRFVKGTWEAVVDDV